MRDQRKPREKCDFYVSIYSGLLTEFLQGFERVIIAVRVYFIEICPLVTPRGQVSGGSEVFQVSRGCRLAEFELVHYVWSAQFPLLSQQLQDQRARMGNVAN